GKILDGCEGWTRKKRAGEAFCLRKVLVGADPKLCDASPFLDFGRRSLRPIKSTELLRHPVQVRRGHGIPRQTPLQKTFVRESSHLHREIDRCCFLAKAERSVFARDRHYAEVNIMAKPPVQMNLGFAGLA